MAVERRLMTAEELWAMPDGGARHHGPEDEVEGGDVLPGFGMRLADLLRRPGQPRG